MKKESRGFTLIELLVVIAIIGILSGIVLVSLRGARSKARDAARQADMGQVITAQEMYYSDEEEYFPAAAQEGVPAITPYLRELNDPQCRGGSCVGGQPNYSWMDNTQGLDCNDPLQLDANVAQWFCVYAELETIPTGCTTAAYFAASHRGTKTVCDDTPTIDTDCTCF